MDKLYQASASAPVNIAVIKYWGKRDTTLNLPTNSSLSVTLDPHDLCATTTACACSSFKVDRLFLNKNEEALTKRAKSCLERLREMRRKVEDKDPSKPKISSFSLHIVSENNFPTAAGLASSAAGFAALVAAVARLYELEATPEDLSEIARLGSGSACRSLLGGYVSWEMGKEKDGSDSRAQQVAPTQHWPEMRAAILVVSSAKKGVPSTTGMQATVATSTLFQHRISAVVPARMQQMQQAIREKDFSEFAMLTMKDSNQFHACCLDTMPPVFYLNDTSRAITQVVDELNRVHNGFVAAYTFDAGPNAVVYYQAKDEKAVLGTLYNATGPIPGWDSGELSSYSLHDDFERRFLEPVAGGVSSVILSRVGQGAKPETISLVNSHGLPVST